MEKLLEQLKSAKLAYDRAGRALTEAITSYDKSMAFYSEQRNELNTNLPIQDEKLT
jgi:hypothetical protein